MQDTTEVAAGLGIGMQRLEAVNDDHTGSAFADEIADPVEDPDQAVLVQH
jgi:hypothetical protein